MVYIFGEERRDIGQTIKSQALEISTVNLYSVNSPNIFGLKTKHGNRLMVKATLMFMKLM